MTNRQQRQNLDNGCQTIISTFLSTHTGSFSCLIATRSRDTRTGFGSAKPPWNVLWQRTVLHHGGRRKSQESRLTAYLPEAYYLSGSFVEQRGKFPWEKLQGYSGLSVVITSFHIKQRSITNLIQLDQKFKAARLQWSFSVKTKSFYIKQRSITNLNQLVQKFQTISCKT